MGLRRLAISNPSADTDTTLFTADNQYLMSVIATNLSASASNISVWVEPSGSSASADYAYIVYDLPVDGKNSYETFRFAVNQNDIIKVRTNANDMSFQSYGLVQFDVNLGVGVSSFQSASPTNVVDGLIWVDSDGVLSGTDAKPAYVWSSASSTWIPFAGEFDSSANYTLTGNNTLSGTSTFTGEVLLSSSTSIGDVSSIEISYIDGATSNIQDQINLKANSASPTFTGTVVLPSTTSIGNISSTEIQYLDNVTSNIQTQLNNKVSKNGVNYALSSSTVTTVNSSTPTVIASATITTNGNPVLIVATGDGNPANTGDWNYVRIYRDSTPIGKYIIFQTSGASHNHAFAQTTIDVPASGTYTYTLRAWTGQGTMTYGETGNDQAPTLICLELF